MNEGPPEFVVSVKGGSILIPFETYETYLRSITAVALMIHSNEVILIPLIHDSAGGLLLKIRNAKGDRIVHSQEFLRSNGIEETDNSAEFPVVWLPDRGALHIMGLKIQATLDM